MFNHLTVDGFFTDAAGDMSWAHRRDPEWTAFMSENASGGGALMFGRITYQQMAGFWPTPAGRAVSPVVADRMNQMEKIVFSRTLKDVSWENTTLLSGDIAAHVRRLKAGPGPDMVILGSGTIVAQLTEAGLIDEYQIVRSPVVLGAGRSLFDGVTRQVPLDLRRTRAFANGNVVSWYEPANANLGSGTKNGA